MAQPGIQSRSARSVRPARARVQLPHINSNCIPRSRSGTELLHLILLSGANTNWLIVPAVATRPSALANKGGICVPKPVQESRKESSWRQAEPARTSLTSVRQVSKEFCHLRGSQRSAISQYKEPSEREQNATIFLGPVGARQTCEKQFLEVASLRFGPQRLQEGS